jgi:hypothetical protein
MMPNEIFLLLKVNYIPFSLKKFQTFFEKMYLLPEVTIHDSFYVFLCLIFSYSSSSWLEY